MFCENPSEQPELTVKLPWTMLPPIQKFIETVEIVGAVNVAGGTLTVAGEI